MNSNPRVSAVIPTLKDTPALQHLLEQLTHQNIFEIIVVQSNKASQKILPSPRHKLLIAEQGRGSQIQAGLNVATGDIIWILHSDSQLPEDAAQSIRHIMENPNNTMGCFPLVFNSQRLTLRFFAGMTRLESALTTFGDQGFFFRSSQRTTLPDLNQYPLLEDVILRRYLKQKGHIKKAHRPLMTDAKRFLSKGIWKTQARNGWILLRFLFGTSPQKLYDEYYENY